MLIIAYIIFGIGCLMGIGLLLMLTIVPLAEKPKGQRLKAFWKGILITICVVLLGFALVMLEKNFDKLFPHKPTAKEIVLKRYPWAQDDMPESYYEGILDAMDYD